MENSHIKIMCCNLQVCIALTKSETKSRTKTTKLFGVRLAHLWEKMWGREWDRSPPSLFLSTKQAHVPREEHPPTHTHTDTQHLHEAVFNRISTELDDKADRRTSATESLKCWCGDSTVITHWCYYPIWRNRAAPRQLYRCSHTAASACIQAATFTEKSMQTLVEHNFGLLRAFV